MNQTIILGTLDITPLLNASAMLDEALKQAQSKLEQAGAIQHFEFCYELAWKTMRRILLQKGLEANSPRDVFRLAAQNNLIKNPEPWFETIRRRNLTTHTYDREIAEAIFTWLPVFQSELKTFIETIKKLS